MAWWVLTYLYNSRAWTTLYTLAWTNRDAHLFMAWANYKPARRKVYKNVRGLSVHCGYRWVWDTPNITEQNEPGDTYTHTFTLAALQPTDHVWYCLFSLAPTLDRQCQGPLIHIPPPEIPMASARIFNSLDQTVQHNTNTPVSFDSVAWDDAGFYDPLFPTRLTIPLDGLYSVGCCIRFATTIAPGFRIQLRRAATDIFLQHSHRQEGLDWAGAAISMHTIQRFLKDHYLHVYAYHIAGIPRLISALPNFSPHFWIAYLGPYPP